MEVAERDKNGLFAPGNKLATGRPPSVWAGQADVSEALLRKYTPEEIIALASDTKRMSKELSSFQAIILIQLANALSARDNNDNALERERLLDRVVGKPVSRTEQKISVSIETENALLEGRRRVAKARKSVDVNYSVVEDTSVIDDAESELSSAEKLSVDEKLEAKRAKAKAYQREYYAKVKAEGRLSFNDRLAMRNTDGIVTNDDKSE